MLFVDTDQLEWIWKRMEIGEPLPGWRVECEGHLHFLERTDDAARWWRFAPDGPWLPALDAAEPPAPVRLVKAKRKRGKTPPPKSRRAASAPKRAPER
jgi:hypothetical protein